MKNHLAIVLPLLASLYEAVFCQVSSDVQCFQTPTCVDVSVTMSLRECCVDTPDGVGFVQNDDNLCRLCVVFGWLRSVFSEVESDSSYTTGLGFLKGLSRVEQFSDAEFSIIVSNGTAYEGVDFYVNSTERLTTRTTSIELVLIDDGVALESEENFRLILVSTSSISELGFFLLDQLAVTIIDSNVAIFNLEQECSGEEGGSIITHIIKENDVTLAHQVTFIVTPLTVQDAMGREELFDIPPDSTTSPNRADYTDFDSSPQSVTFVRDEGREFVRATEFSILIQDDDINESQKEYFFIKIDDPTFLLLDENFTLCSIRDNDDIRLGFERGNYLFVQPLSAITDDDTIYLAKENERVSEQTFFIRITAIPALILSNNTVPAVLNRDYSLTEFELNFATLLFPPHMDRLPIQLNLLAPSHQDSRVEFQLVFAAIEGTPHFQPPKNLFEQSIVTIEALNIGFISQQLQVFEGSVATLQVSVLSGTLTTNVTVLFSTQDNTAIRQQDYLEVTNLPLFLGPTSSSVTVNVNTFASEGSERDETFRCSLQFDANDADDIPLSLSPSEAIVTIQDLDSDGPVMPDGEDDVVVCYTTNNCDGQGLAMTVRQCCVESAGLSYFGKSGCTVCVVYGWNSTSLTLTEGGQGLPYVLELNLVKGSLESMSGEIVLEIQDEQANDLPVLYFLNIRELRISVMSPSATFEITLPPNLIVQESDGLIRLTLVYSPGSPILSGLLLTNPLEITVQDNTPCNIRFAERDYLTLESERLDIDIMVEIEDNFAPSFIMNPISIRVTALTVEDSLLLGNPHIIPPATSPFSPNLADYDDFQNISKVVNVTESMIGVPITIIDDEVNEAYDQIFVVMLELVDALYPSLITINQEDMFTLVIIADNDDINIGFQLLALTVEEPSGGVTAFINSSVIVKDKPSEQTFIFDLFDLMSGPLPDRPVSGSGCIMPSVGPAMVHTGPGDENGDYEIISTTNNLIFPPELQTLSIELAIFGDNQIEGRECFGFMIINEFGPVFNTQVFRQDQVVFIADNSIIQFGLEQDSYSVPESIGNVEICTVIDPSDAVDFISNGFSVFVDILPITAGNNDILYDRNDIQYLQQSQPRQCFSVTIVDDDLREPSESFNITLAEESITFLEERYTISISHAILTIRVDENDRTDVVRFLSTPLFVSEGDSVQVLIGVQNMEGPSNNDTVALLSIQDKSEADISEVTVPVFLVSPRVPIQFSLVDNDVYELNSIINLSLSLVSPDFGAVIEDGSIMISLLDEDILQFGWDSASFIVSEGAGVINIPISFSGDAGLFLIVVNGTIEDESAQAGADYLADSTFEVFLSNRVRCQNISVALLQDGFSELDEVFTLVLENVLLIDQFTLEPRSVDRDRLQFTIREATVTILDDDVVAIGILNVPSDVIVSEDVGSVEFEVGVIRGLLRYDVTVVIETMTISATADLDYNSTQFNFTLSTVQERHFFNVCIIDDLKLEKNETFALILTVPNISRNVQLLTPKIILTIVDNDVAELGFFSDEVFVTEGGIAQILVGISEGFLDVVINATVFTIPGTAEAGEDYNSITIPLSIFGNETFLVNVTLLDDNEVEDDNETFMLQLLVDDPPANLIYGLLNATIIITENDVVSNIAGSSNTTDIIIGVLVALSVVLFVVILFFILILYSRKYKKKVEIINNLYADRNVYSRAGGTDVCELSHVMVQKSFRVNVPKHLIIDSCNLQLNDPVGQGEYGIVYKGKMAEGFNQSFSRVVAVKTLKGFLEKELIKDLLKECTKMSKFDHPNVLTLIGVCLDGGPAPYIVMPFMFNGSLLSYLKKERDNLILPPEQELDSDLIAVSSKLMGICLQVAKGMEYLTSQRVIHRDLAARNCMIDINFVIKVADFGLSETIDPSKDYFRQDRTQNMKLPVKWLAPECLSDGIFSEKSDVWAFGITCWEVYSGGKMPYSGVNPTELPHMLENGYRMKKPDNSACPAEMFDVMTKCWTSKAETRPTFSDIVTNLSQTLEGLSGYTSLSVEESK